MSSSEKLLDKPSGDSTASSAAFPLSFGQQRLWFLDQLEPASGAYNISVALRLRGSLDVAALKKSLNEILRRHDALRTCFPSCNGMPVQAVSAPARLDLPELDLRGVAEACREAEALRIAADEVAAPFDLARGPLVRGRRLRLAEHEHVLLLTMHHIVFDAWSRGVLLTELAALYDAFRKGLPSPLPELPIQYADYALWEREWLSGEILAQQLAYWRKQLANLPVLELPTDRPRPPVQSFSGAHHSISFSNSLVDALRETARRERTTPYNTLLAAFLALLSRYTGQEDIVVGSPIGSRARSEIERLIGFFVSTLVLRADFSGDPSFRELLGRVREAAHEAYEHQDLPFEKLVQELQPERDLSANPLFQVTFVSQSAPGDDPDLPDLTVTDLGIVSRKTRFDLEVHVFEKPESLSCTFIYATDLFDPETILRMIGHYRTLLESIVADPGRRISELPMISEAERRRVVEEWNETRTEYPRDKAVDELFEEQAARTPAAEAIAFGRKRLSYAQLNERANRLARYLQKRGVGPKTLVGLCVERSLEMVVGLLGILKAGGAYVPLDPAYPRQRLAFMLEETAAPVVLTQERIGAALPEGPFQRVRLDADWRQIARESDENVSAGATAEDLAYVMYTSGSTGCPKGVSIRHRSVVRLVRSTDYASLGPEEVFLQLAPISFDASTFELWAPLLNGARLALMRPGIPSLEELGDVLKRYKVSTLWLTAGLFHQVVETQIESLRGVRQLLAGGDTLSVSDVEKVRRELPDCRLINGYGPTENTTFTCCHTVGRDELLGARVPIGRPIANTRIFILDRNLRPVPIGVPGELCAGGDGLARDYFRRPELTAQKFVPDPFASSGSEERLYRTGDRARFRADGAIEFLGRFDQQIKIRGYRVEIGEIEEALARHPEVEASAVAAREQGSGDRRLIAYVVPREGVRPTPGELRDFLKTTLPDYMVPSAFVSLEALPLTSNGKVDRKALPAPEQPRLGLEDVSVPPSNPVEQTIARIWRELLDLEKVGVHDNFFDVGGHSLLAVRLVAEIEKALGYRVALATIFQAPTVAQLAEIFREGRHRKRRTPSLVAIQPKGTKPPFFCVHANTGIVYYRTLARHLGADRPFYGLQSQGLDGRCAPYERVEDMAAHYIQEIRELQPEGPYYLGGHSFGGKVAFEMARQLHSRGQRVALLALLDTASFPGDPTATRLRFFRRRAQFHIASLKTIGPKQKASYLLRRAETLLVMVGRALSRGYEEIRHPLRRAQRKVLEANTRAYLRYVPGFYEGGVTVFRAKDAWKDAGNVRLLTDPQLGWGKLCGGGVEVYEVPGGHASMLQEEANVRALAEKLSDCLRNAGQPTLRRAEAVPKNSGPASSAPLRPADAWSMQPL